MYVCMYVCIYIYVCSMYIYVHACMYIRVYVKMYAYVYVCMYVCMYVRFCILTMCSYSVGSFLYMASVSIHQIIGTQIFFHWTPTKYANEQDLSICMYVCMYVGKQVISLLVRPNSSAKSLVTMESEERFYT